MSARDRAAETARIRAEAWGRKAGARVWSIKTARLTPERALLEEACAHDAAVRAARAAHEHGVGLDEASS